MRTEMKTLPPCEYWQCPVESLVVWTADALVPPFSSSYDILSSPFTFLFSVSIIWENDPDSQDRCSHQLCGNFGEWHDRSWKRFSVLLILCKTKKFYFYTERRCHLWKCKVCVLIFYSITMLLCNNVVIERGAALPELLGWPPAPHFLALSLSMSLSLLFLIF